MITDNLKKRFSTSLVLLILTFLIFNFNIILAYFLIISGVLAILEFLNITKKIFSNKFYSNFLDFLFIIYIFIFCFLFFYISSIHGLKILLYIILLGCVASDMGGFIFGKIFKGPKLTNISPKKTYSGAIGSLIISSMTISFLFFYFINIFNLKIIIIALATSFFCQLGDLLFSYLKRVAKIKDTGSFLPGHGGILDRLDGIFLGLPLGFLTIILLN